MSFYCDVRRKPGKKGNSTQVNKGDTPPLPQSKEHRKRMPSASAKIEKIASIEAADPAKQFNFILERKVRNLEKRKLKLDNYKSDVENGKELNDDQKLAVNKYESVVDLLEYSKELCKLLNATMIESSRQQKKLAKKEQIERQQHEIKRLQEGLYYKHILSCLESGETRDDFLNGDNGAIKISKEDMLRLNQLYKLVEPSLPNDQADLESHFHVLAENLIFVVEGRNKEVAGTTYKAMKDLLQRVKESGYFSKQPENNEVLSDDAPELDEPTTSVENEQAFMDEVPKLEEDVPSEYIIENSAQPEPVVEYTNGIEAEEEPTVPEEEEPEPTAYVEQNGSLQEVLTQGNFNFLQESQIELDTPHMDPAVVAVHPMPPPTNLAYPMTAYPGQVDETHNNMTNELEHVTVTTTQPITLISTTIPRTMSLTSVQHNAAADFDPSHPIPTQTYTNQSFTVMQNMIMQPAYVPVTMHHGPLPPHMTPIAVVPGLSSPVSTPNAVPIHVAVSVAADVGSMLPPSEQMTGEPEVEVEQVPMNGISHGDPALQNDITDEKAVDAEGFTTQNNFQRGYRGRGRGRGAPNGYFRPRGYHNARGGYQNNYYQGNFRRGGPRGVGRGNGGNMRGGRGTNYRPAQQQQQQQSQQQPPPQQQQQSQPQQNE